jgi:superfamily II DNA or RNA helicase
MTLEQISVGLDLAGVEPVHVVKVVAAQPMGDGALLLIYRMPDGALKERLLSRADEASISMATAERPFAFDGDGAAFQLACEAKRLDLAFLFDPMLAVHTSNVEPLPHQITAVYESMLPRQPLRFLLADDPGAGKTIMAGLYIRELLLRADARRIVIVAPGGLVEQWRDELYEKFGLEFSVYSPALDLAAPTGNVFDDFPRLIVRLDQFSRNDELQDKLCAAGWDLVVFDEAHKLAAHYFGSELKKTARFQFAERLGTNTRHLLLMTATPHDGKEADFQLFLSLLDSDRFYGKFRDGVHKVDASDLMRRMVKEELVKFDGTPLFPPRHAYTVNYTLSDLEVRLYDAVTHYVQTEMGKADQLDGSRRGSVGFALTSLQRRLASSPEAIFQSLKHRRERLEKRLREERLGLRATQFQSETLEPAPEDDDDLTSDDQEQLEETLVDQATAAASLSELAAEIEILKDLEQKARELVASGQDRKWDELSKTLQDNPAMHDASGRQRKIIIFSEHRDTIRYLHDKICGVLGTSDAIVTIDGTTHRDERRKIQAMFRSDPEVRVLIATDAAGEGVNLQVANLMVNYDLPWNPNRLEQRFGRIHRIGQTETCHLWSLVAKETREGDVYHRLLKKIEVENEALQGRVFDILGEVFEETSLKDLLIRAIRFGEDPKERAYLTQQVDNALDRDHLKQLLDRNALAQEIMSPDRLFAVKEEMEKAEARRLQPYFVRSFFLKAFESLGGTAHRREAGRFEITYVPSVIRDRDRLITGRNRREQEPVLSRYERICFDRDEIQPADRPGCPRAVLMHPGHPLMLALTDIILERYANLLRQGAVLVDPSDEGVEPWLLILLTHEVKGADGTVLSRRMQFVRVAPDGSASFAGWAPHLDLEALPESRRQEFTDILSAPWATSDVERRALDLAASSLAIDHYNEVAGRRIAHVEKTLTAVHERLTKEIGFWQDRWMKLREDQSSGRDVRLNLENVRRSINDLEGRLGTRKRELEAMRHVMNGTPVVLGGAMVLPAGLLRQREAGEPAVAANNSYSADAEARARIERIAMDAVQRAEESRNCRVVDVSKEKCGWDLTSYPPAADGKLAEPRHIEVKGRVKSQDTVCITRNEMLYGFNQGSKFVVAIVLVGADDKPEGPYYVRNVFDREPAWGVASANYRIGDLLTRAENQ